MKHSNGADGTGRRHFDCGSAVVLLRARHYDDCDTATASTPSASTSTSRTSSVSAAGDDVPQLSKTCAWQQCHVYYLTSTSTAASASFTSTSATSTVPLRLLRGCDCASAALGLRRLRRLDYVVQLRLRFCDCASATALLSRMQLLCPACSYGATANSDCWACDCWAPTAELRLLRFCDCAYCDCATTTAAPLRLGCGPQRPHRRSDCIAPTTPLALLRLRC